MTTVAKAPENSEVPDIPQFCHEKKNVAKPYPVDTAGKKHII